MKKLSRLSVISLAVSGASLLFASAACAGHPDYKHEVYKGETAVVPVVAAPCVTSICLKDGLYIGAGLGYDVFKARQSITLSTPDGIFSYNPTLSAKGWNGSVFAGYGQYYDRLYIAGELAALTSGAHTSYGISAGADSFTTSLDARTSYSAAILPGFKLTNSTLAYVRLGYVRTSFKSHERFASPGAIATYSKDTWLNGINYGVGMETAVCNNISVRGEYTYTSYGSFNSPLGTKFAPANNQFVLSGIYHIA